MTNKTKWFNWVVEYNHIYYNNQEDRKIWKLTEEKKEFECVARTYNECINLFNRYLKYGAAEILHIYKGEQIK